jgi:hypothetical protein
VEKCPPPEMASSEPAHSLPPPPPPSPMTGAMCGGATGDDWGLDDGEWGDDDAGPPEADLAELLQLRDLSLSTTVQASRTGEREPRTKARPGGGGSKGGACPAKEGPADAPLGPGSYAFPAFEVVQVPEPEAWGKGAGDVATEALLSRYYEEEEDRELVALLQGGAQAVHASSRGAGAQADEEAYEKVPPEAKAFLKFQVSYSSASR